MDRRGCTHNWLSAESDVLIATPLTLPPWIVLRMRRCRRSLVVSCSIYHIVLDPSDYSKLIRLLFRESSEPDTLNIPVDGVVKPMGHFRKRSFCPIIEYVQIAVRVSLPQTKLSDHESTAGGLSEVRVMRPPATFDPVPSDILQLKL